MFRALAFALLLSFPIVAVSVGSQDPEPRKDKPKKEKGRREASPPGFPDFEKLVPADATPEQREQMRKMYDEMKKRMANMPGGGFPGARPAFPGGGFPGGGPGFPGGGPGGPGMPMMMPGMPFAMTSPRLGAAVEPASLTLLDQLDLPAKQGIVVHDLRKDSPADKAGLKNHDILIEINGKPVPNRMDGLFKILHDIKADEKVEAVVVRKGKKVNIKELTLPEGQIFGPPAGFRPGGGFPAGLPGAFPAPPGAQPNRPGAQKPGDR